MAASVVKCCVFLFGNSARGDDALGERLYEILQRDWDAHNIERNNLDLKLIMGFQLEPEHIFDLRDADLGIFVDAHRDGNSGVRWRETAAGTQLQFSTHHLPVESLLFLYESTFGNSAPPCYLLSIAGNAFELGAELSAAAQCNLQIAHRLILEKLQAAARRQALS